MKYPNVLLLLFLCQFLFSCGSDHDEKISEYSLKIADENKEFQLGETITAEITGPSKDSVVYFLGEQRLTKTIGNENLKYTFNTEKLGKWPLLAKIYISGEVEEISQEITLFNDTPPELYTYEIIARYPHATDAYTQGLEFHDNILYESTGQYGESTLRKVDYETGEVLQEKALDETYFAEGLSILNGKIYQLTWKEGIGFIYDLETFEELGTFAYDQSEEGWGLTNDGENFYKSDGTEKIWILDGETLAEKGYIQTVTNRIISTKLNELEWVEGLIYANTYQEDGVAIIDPENGAVVGVINFRGLREELGNEQELDDLNDVLNGIAYNPQTGKLYVTGKNWDTLFEVEIMEKE